MSDKSVKNFISFYFIYFLSFQKSANVTMIRALIIIAGLSVVTMCVDLASTHLKAYFTRIHYFGRAKRFLGMSEDLREIVALLGAMRRKKGGKVIKKPELR